MSEEQMKYIASEPPQQFECGICGALYVSLRGARNCEKECRSFCRKRRIEADSDVVKGVTMKTSCCVCGTDDDGQGLGAWNNKYYCAKCFCSTFGVNKRGTLVTSKEIACKGCGKLTLTSSYKREGWQILNDHYYCSDCATVGKPETTPTMKSSNPKDLAAVTRVPMHLWPMTATVHGCAGIYDGMRKYGYYNWRHDKVSVMTYLSALQRHMTRYIEGEWAASDSRVSHLGHILACVAILVDAHESGQIIDDRPIAGSDIERLMEETERLIERITERHKDKHPVHYYRGTEVTP